MSTDVAGTGRFRAGDRQGATVRSLGSRGRAISWLVVRLTGLFLSVLVLGHFALTHIIIDVADTGASFVARRWSSAFWLTWDWLMLASAVVHGVAGVWIAIDDYAPAGPRRRGLHWLLLVVGTLVFIIGTVTITTAILG